jgi:hypothetical protein
MLINILTVALVEARNSGPRPSWRWPPYYYYYYYYYYYTAAYALPGGGD